MRHIAAIVRGATKDGGHRVPFQNRQSSIAAGRKKCESDQMTYEPLTALVARESEAAQL